MSTPMRRTRSGCCARAATGQAAVVLARPAMKLRRLMGVAPWAERNTLAHHGTTTAECGTAKALMSALGQKRTLGKARLMSALPAKADIADRGPTRPFHSFLISTDRESCRDPRGHSHRQVWRRVRRPRRWSR